ncbi:MAG: hypothetical protein QOG77_2414, partial [Solirubrobacteraceae bacterium]|nr:hypothetical protein [Solirubrobacteraceae bacterium]
MRRGVLLVLLALFTGADARAATCAVDGRVTVRSPHGVRKAAVFVDGHRRGSVRRGAPRKLRIASGRTVRIRLVGRRRSGQRVVRRMRARVCSVPPGTATPAPAGEQLRYEGRWNVTAGRATTVNSGSRIFLRFTGNEITGVFDAAGMKHPPQIYTWLDGKRGDARDVNERRIRLTPRNLASGAHTLVLGVKDVSQEGNRWQPPLESALHVTGFEP